jgi:hypothetical protein
MAISDNSAHDQQLLSGGLTRRQSIPLLGATAVLAAAAPRPAGADKPSAAQARFVYVGTYTFPGIPPGGTHQSTALGLVTKQVIQINACSHDQWAASYSSSHRGRTPGEGRVRPQCGG